MSVAGRPQLGGVIIDADPANQHHLHAAVVFGWQRAAITVEFAEQASAALLRVDATELAGPIATMLAYNTVAPDSAGWYRSSASRDLAERLWSALDRSRPPVVSSDNPDAHWNSVLDAAYKTPAGQLAQYWLHVLVACWTDAGKQWHGLPTDLRDSFLTTIASDADDEVDQRPCFARAMYVSRLHMFWQADRNFARTCVMPLLAWQGNAAAADMWDAFLRQGRWNDDMLDAGLLDGYVQTARNLIADDGRRDSRDRTLPSHLAGVALRSTLDLHSTGWLRQITTALDDQHRARWFAAIARSLPDNEDAAETEWARWMRAYLHDRITGVPRPMQPAESSALLEYLLKLRGSFTDAVDMLRQTPANLNSERFVLTQFPSELAETHPPRRPLCSRTCSPTLRSSSTSAIFNVWSATAAHTPTETTSGSSAPRRSDSACPIPIKIIERPHLPRALGPPERIDHQEDLASWQVLPETRCCPDGWVLALIRSYGVPSLLAATNRERSRREGVSWVLGA